jgi:hypothetical protein
MAPKSKRSGKGKQRMTPEEIFSDPAIADMKIEIESKLFTPDEDDPFHIGKGKGICKESIRFHRNIIDDLRPEPETIMDDLITNAAIFAHYGFMLAKLKRFLARCEQEYQITWNRVYMHRSKAIFRDPDIDPKMKTQTYIKADVDNTQSVCLMLSIIDDVKSYVLAVEEGMKALEQKHYNCQAISRMLSGEAKLIGSTYVSSQDREKTTKTKIFDSDETES